jgi:DNA-binding response OmpR family regulator
MQFLLVEDEPPVARAIEKGLAREGHRVDIAGCGVTGLQMARGGEYDVIILDVMLPGSTGFEVASELRAEGNATPILMLTALDSTDDVVQGLDAGADDYLTKPFEFDEMLARLRALGRRTRPGGTSTLRFADIALDRAVRTATRAGLPLRLTHREFRLLEVLMESPGQTCSREHLLEHVWGIRFDPHTRLVDVHVANLRKKLAGSGTERLIASVRGVGYRLVWPGCE